MDKHSLNTSLLLPAAASPRSPLCPFSLSRTKGLFQPDR